MARTSSIVLSFGSCTGTARACRDLSSALHDGVSGQPPGLRRAPPILVHERWGVLPTRSRTVAAHARCMHAVWFETYALPVETKAGVITVRPLRNGDTATVQRVVERLGKRKKIVTARELESFARVDAHRHVLIAYAYGEPIAIAQLVRDVADPRSAEVASAVADGWQRLD